MDGRLTGALTGLGLGHSAAHLYRALLEASAFGLRWIVDVLRDGGVPVRRFVATGGLPHHNPLFVQICADVLRERILVHPSTQGPALGAATLGVLAAGRAATGFASTSSAVHAMARAKPGTQREPIVVRPNRRHAQTYEGIYQKYRKLAKRMQDAVGDLT